MILAAIVAAAWVAVLLTLLAVVRRDPMLRHRCQWCGDVYLDGVECWQHEEHCPGNPTNHPRRVR